jgi:hypothetical protein
VSESEREKKKERKREVHPSFVQASADHDGRPHRSVKKKSQNNKIIEDVSSV